uniref:Uncharacterized protein n=1 Tax=Theropithecus gelada TaxID=9565 RepID=A0A8D2FET5_THEGE
MRQTGLGEGVPPGKYGNYGYANSEYSACEEENERLTESLRSKVTATKSLSIEVDHEYHFDKNQHQNIPHFQILLGAGPPKFGHKLAPKLAINKISAAL